LNSRLEVAAAFLAVYIIWGSTYLAIRIVEESLPPFFMAGTRFLLAGIILYALSRVRGASRETKSDWGRAATIGGLMLLGGHGAVVWAEQWVPSGLTSLLIATVPLWLILIDSIQLRTRPNVRVIGGLTLGFVGVILLISSFESLGEGQITLIGGAVLMGGAFLWANGSLYSRSAKLPSSQMLATAMEMVAGGMLLLLASAVSGEISQVRLDLVSERSLVAWMYLVLFGSLVGFTCYIWLLKKVSPARVSTYAYVNPIVAMFLGWALASEPLTFQSVIAAVVILASVAIITTKSKPTTKREFS
jgi:drug/metabolite transporter (DMT)-like permease